MLRLTRALNVSSFSKVVVSNSRAFGGHAGGHGDHHGHSDDYHTGGIYQPVYHPPVTAKQPYEVPHEHVDRTKAFIFGEDPAHKKSEGWEGITYLTLFISAFILGYSHYVKGEDPLRVCYF